MISVIDVPNCIFENYSYKMYNTNISKQLNECSILFPPQGLLNKPADVVQEGRAHNDEQFSSRTR